MAIVKPNKLKKGDLIGLISPASCPKDLTRIEKATKYFESMGYNVEVGKNAQKTYGYLAGTDEERVDDLHYMFGKKEVKAIMCLRGGYGTGRLVRFLDFKLIKKNPKIFIGYSDITVLQMAFYQMANLVTFAGPMAAVDFWDQVVPYTEENFWRAVTSTKKIGKVPMPDENFEMQFGNKYNSQKTEDKAEGTILGGNLTLFTVLLGSKYFPKMKNNILMLEDVDEVPYRIDRYFTKLANCEVWKNVNGLILGQFTDCEEKEEGKLTLTLDEVFRDFLGELKIPIVSNFPHGHVKNNYTVPFGTNVKMNMKKKYIEFTESAVQ